MTALQKAIQTFEDREDCKSPYFCEGACDGISEDFIRHAESYGLKGIILALDNPFRRPTEGWGRWGGDWRKTGAVLCSHYIAYFPSLGLGVDWTARQFWHKCRVPKIQNKEQLVNAWSDFPFGWKDARLEEEYVAGSFIGE